MTTSTNTISKGHPRYNITRLATAVQRIATRDHEQIKVYIQEDGTLRLAARSVAHAKVVIDRAERATGLKLEDLSEFLEIRFWGTDLIGCYRTHFTRDVPADECRQSRMVKHRSSIELVERKPCTICGQQPLHHTPRCKNRRH
jgi:hypothetical protein